MPFTWENLKFDRTEIHGRNGKNAIVMFSGGLDSTVALWWTLDHYENIKVLTIDYNQHHIAEIDYARRIARLIGANYQIIKIDIPKKFWGIEHCLTRGQAGLMTAIAALDIGHDGADIVHGILRTDDTYGDCNRTHLDSLAEILSHPNDVADIGIATPLRAVKDKQAVMALGFMYGAPIKWTWSCRSPERDEPCMKCTQCREREKIKEDFFEVYGIELEMIEKWQNVMGSPFHPCFQGYSQDIEVLVRAFIEMGGLKNSVPGWKYMGPDGKYRIATAVRDLGAIDFPGICQGTLCKHIQVHGELEDGSRWEICVCEDGTVAVTDRLPRKDVLEVAFRKKLVSEIMG